MMFTFHALTA